MQQLGLYGKLPGQGDFVTRRLPRAFVDRIDAWLQELLAQSQSQLGERWLDAYMDAPIWRFVLGPGVSSATQWVGVLVPSVDRVGRWFPFVVAAPAPWHADPASVMAALDGWHESLERHCLHALQTRCDLDQLDAALQRLVLPRSVPAPLLMGAAVDSDDTLPLPTRSGGAAAPGNGEDTTLPLPEATTLPSVYAFGPGTAIEFAADRVRSVLEGVPQTGCLWAARRADGGRDLLVTEGLPGSLQSCALIDGAWGLHGWACVAG